MITRPIFSFAQLTNPTWNIQTTGGVKTTGTSGPSASSWPSINSTGGSNNVALYAYSDGYRELNIQGIRRKYIDPISGTTLLDNNSTIHGSVFISKLSIPMGSNYTNYLATGVFINDYGWERCDDEYSGEVGTEECGKTHAYRYSVSNGKSFVEEKIIVFSRLAMGQGEAPVFPYKTDSGTWIWHLKDVKNA